MPYVNDFTKEIPTLLGTKVRRVSDMGFPKIAYQTFKLLAYQRLHEMARQWQERYPGVDIVLIEPEPDDELMFQTNILNYTSRLDIARHGFESVTVKLASDYEDLREVAQRHGIEISATRVRKVVQHFEAEKEKRAPGAGSSSRRPARCCASRPRTSAADQASPRRARRSRSAYFSLTTLRLTFSVGVSSPVSCERSWSRSANFLIFSTCA